MADGARHLCRCGNAINREANLCDKCALVLARRQRLERLRATPEGPLLGRPPKLNAAQVAEIDAWYASHVTRKEMACRMGVTMDTLMRYARRNGIARRK